MKNEYILWAVKIGEADFMEQVITTNYDRAMTLSNGLKITDLIDFVKLKLI